MNVIVVQAELDLEEDVAFFSMLADVESRDLFLLRNSKTHRNIQQLEQDEAGDPRIDPCHCGSDELSGQNVATVRIESQWLSSADIPNRSRCENTRQDRAQRSPESMDAERIEGVIVTEFVFEYRAGQSADKGCDRAHRNRWHGSHEACGGSDADQARNRARGGTKERRFAASKPFPEWPDHRAGGCRKVSGREGR